MLASLARFIVEWSRRRAHLQAADDDPNRPEGWLCLIQIRILSYLLARYSPPAKFQTESLAPAAPLGARPLDFPPIAFCIVTELTAEQVHPPEFIAARLRDIAASNRISRAAWWVWP